MAIHSYGDKGGGVEKLTGTRAAIGEAAVHLVADHGLEGVSVRKVAARAGVSPGLVQHHYPTKRSLVLAAMNHVEAAVQRRLELLRDDQAPADHLRGLAEQLLPLDPARVAEARVWLAFVAKAAIDPTIAEVHSTSWQQLEDIFAHLIAGHRGRGRPDRLDRERAALLLAGLDGLAATAVSEPGRLPPARTQALADRLLRLALDDA